MHTNEEFHRFGTWVVVLAVVAALIFGSVLGALFYRSYVGSKQRQTVCTAVIALIQDAKQLTEHPPPNLKQDPEQRRRALAFYNRNLKRLRDSC